MRDLWMRLGVLLILVGLGSAILHSFTIYQFQYLMWADGAEPYVGFGIAAVGVALAVGPSLLRGTNSFPYADETRVMEPFDPPTVPIPAPTGRRSPR